MSICPITPLTESLGLILLVTSLAMAGCDTRTESVAGPGNPDAGERLILSYGCDSCHRIPGIPGADGEVGPPLENIRERAYLAGIVPNSFDNMVLWLVETQRIAPGSAMPNLGLSASEAEDIAAYLYQLD